MTFNQMLYAEDQLRTGEMSNEFGKLLLQNGEQAVAEPGKKPAKTAVLASARPDIIQWCLYYPGVLDLRDLLLSAEEQRILEASLAAYKSGDLLQGSRSIRPTESQDQVTKSFMPQLCS
ncbi:MAG: hypothetical protein FJ403_14990 [Verrucomicrobia bacterium]|nr:hypothetical protein [Verrucomicrobiota bacterium]